MTLKVLTTSRAIRHYITNNSLSNSEKLIAIGDFESRVVLVSDLIFIDPRLRVFYFQKACSFEKFSELNIDIDFFVFVKNYDILFKFFSELLSEGVSIEDIELSDTYAEYGSHLDILKQVLINYQDELQHDGYTDTIFTPKNYVLNSNYINDFDSIEIYLNGYLSNFEYQILQDIAHIVELKIIFNPNKLNTKMSVKFEKLFDIKFDEQYKYTLNLSTHAYIATPKDTIQYVYDEYEAKTRLEQVAFVKKKVYDYVQDGLKPENIVVITPDETFAEILSDFDDENNFNFAMGFPYTNTKVYQKLDAIYRYLNDKTQENRYRLQRYDISTTWIDEYLMGITSFATFDNVVLEIILQEEYFDIYEEEIFYFKKITHKIDWDIKSILFVLLASLSKRAISDNRGGKVTVMGVLESRGVKYDGVVVVDFNETKVPKKSKKDLFLSSEVRKKSGLVTMSDRENLQKSYYMSLFDSAQYVSLSYVKDEVETKSRFLDEIKPNYHKQEINYKSILFGHTKTINPYVLEDLQLDYSFAQISASRLKTFLECKRKYYLRYIKKIKTNPIYDDTASRDVGIAIHEVLKRVYSVCRFYDDIATLKQDFRQALDIYIDQQKFDSIMIFKLDVMFAKMDRFFDNEILRFGMGYQVVYTEKSFTNIYEGINIHGQIDRVDVHEGKFVVYDYKTGSVKLPKRIVEKQEHNIVDFQLEFYYLMLKDIKPIESLYYVDIKNGKYVEETLLDEKLLLLKDIFQTLKEPRHNFVMCEKTSICRFCEYKTICGREV